MTRYVGMKPPDEIVRLQLDLKSAVAHATTTSHPMSSVFRWASSRGDDGYAEVGDQFIDIVRELRPPRNAVSLLIKSLIMALRDEPSSGAFREKTVAHATSFVNALVRQTPHVLLAWAEDMVANDPALGLSRQPLALICGTLFASRFDQKDASIRSFPAPSGVDDLTQEQMLPFWEQAASSARFPLPIFSLPCPYDEGTIFSPNRQRIFGTIFSHVSEDAMRKFAGHIRDHAHFTRVQPTRESEWKTLGRAVRATATDRRNALSGIVASVVTGSARKASVAASLGLMS